MTQIIALTAFATLRLSDAQVHEPVHGRGPLIWSISLLCVTVRAKARSNATYRNVVCLCSPIDCSDMEYQWAEGLLREYVQAVRDCGKLQLLQRSAVQSSRP